MNYYGHTEDKNFKVSGSGEIVTNIAKITGDE